MTSYCAMACIWAVQVCDRLKLFYNQGMLNTAFHFCMRQNCCGDRLITLLWLHALANVSSEEK